MINNDRKFYNYAEREDIRDEAKDILFSAYRACKVNRRPMELDWYRYLKIWAVKRGDKQNYNGRADLKHTTPRRAIETISKKLATNIIPPDSEYIGVSPKPGILGGTIMDAERVKNTIDHYFEGQTNFEYKMIPFFRQLCLYGTSVAKTDWKKVTKKRRNKRGKWEDYDLYNCPEVKTIDIFRFYVFPWTSQSIDDASIVFEEFPVNKRYVKKMQSEGFYTKEADPQAFSKFTHDLNSRLLLWGHNDPSVFRDHKEDIYNLVECYFEMEIDGEYRPVMAHMDEFGNILMITDHPFNHGRAPYSVARYCENPTPFFYGIGAMEPIESLTYEQNDTANQIMDNKTMIMNPLCVIDPYKVKDHASLKFAPGAKWMAEPDAVKWMTVPDVTQTGMQALAWVKNEILEGTDAVPNMPPQMRGASRTATRDMAMNVEMNSELSECLRAARMAVEDIFIKTHSNICQYMPEEEYIKINKKKSGEFLIDVSTPDNLIGDYDFMWKAAPKIASDRVAVNQMINMIGPLAQAGVKIDFDNLARRIFRDGFGMEDYEEFLIGEKFQISMKPELENLLLGTGKFVPVSPNDDDQTHMQEHLKMNWKESKPEVKKVFDDHMKRHQDADQLKKELIQREYQKIQMMKAMAQGQDAQQGQPQGVAGQEASAEATGQEPASAPNESGTPYAPQGQLPSDMDKGVRQ